MPSVSLRFTLGYFRFLPAGGKVVARSLEFWNGTGLVHAAIMRRGVEMIGKGMAYICIQTALIMLLTARLKPCSETNKSGQPTQIHPRTGIWAILVLILCYG